LTWKTGRFEQLWIATGPPPTRTTPSRAATDDVSMHPLNPLSARSARFERITEVLGFADHLPVPELHNAYRVRRIPS
jgi:hypothetical protein